MGNGAHCGAYSASRIRCTSVQSHFIAYARVGIIFHVRICSEMKHVTSNFLLLPQNHIVVAIRCCFSIRIMRVVNFYLRETISLEIIAHV